MKSKGVNPWGWVAVLGCVVVAGVVAVKDSSAQKETRAGSSEKAAAPTRAGDTTGSGACSTARTGMVCVPAGYFTMGSHQGDRDEEPPHRVWVDEFLIDKHEVTFGEYMRCVKAGRCAKPQYSLLNTAKKKKAQKKAKKKKKKKGKKGSLKAAKVSVSVNPKFPVVGVDWKNAQKYCQTLGKRLPSEAEWEKAARGTTKRRYPWGKTPPTCKKANIAACKNGIQEVGKHPKGKSPYGVHDMTGSVWEWVYDWYDSNFYKKSAAAKNPFGPMQTTDPLTGKGHYRYKILRGGSYTGSPSPLWASYRFRLLPTSRSNDIGFRCVLSKVSPPASAAPATAGTPGGTPGGTPDGTPGGTPGASGTPKGDSTSSGVSDSKGSATPRTRPTRPAKSR